MTKILYIIDSLGSGGKERQLYEMIKSMSSYDQFSIEIIVLSNNVYYNDIYNYNVIIHLWPRKSLFDISLLKKIYIKNKYFKPDLIHTWDMFSTLYAIIIAKIFKIKLINGSIRNATPNKMFSKKWILFNLTNYFSDIIISNSKAGLGNKIKNTKYNYIYNGFDFFRIKNIANKKEIRKKLGIKHKYIIAMVASFTKKKDYNSYLLAAKIVLSKRNDVLFFCIGAGPNLMNYSSDINYNNSNIMFLDKISNIEPYINCIDIGVLATSNKFHLEGISNVIMEYMAFAKPVIATNGGGTNEIVIDNKTGFIVQPYSPKEIEEKINYLLKNKSDLIKMGLNGQKRLMKYFPQQETIKRYTDLYNNILDN